MRTRRPTRSATLALVLLSIGALLLVFGIDNPPSSARAADSTVIRIEDGEVVRTIRIDGQEIERMIEDAFAGFDEEEFSRSLAAALEGLEGLGEEIAEAIGDLDFDFDPDRGYAYHYRGHFDEEEFAARMAELGERMAAQQERIAERVQRAVERGQRARERAMIRIERDRLDDDADEETLRSEIRRLERRLQRLQEELQELEQDDSGERNEEGER